MSKGGKSTGVSGEQPSTSKEADATTMTSIINDLRLEIENLKKQTSEQANATASSTTGNGTDAVNPNQPGVFYVARDRKIKPYTGKIHDGRSVEEFLEEVVTAVQVRQIPITGQGAFIVSLLEGPAKEEVKLRRAEKADPQTLASLLRDAFGEKRSTTQLLRSFYDRRQKDGETLRAYSHGLSEVMDKIMSKSPSSVPDRDSSLRDQFADNVRDGHLKRELKRLIRSNPSFTFLDIREEAIRWSEEEERTVNTARKTGMVSETMATAEKQEAQESTIHNMFFKALEEQTKAIEKMAEALKTLQQPQQRTQQQHGKKIVCYNCNKEGHIARNCRTKRNNRNQQGLENKQAHSSEQVSNQLPLSS